MTSQCVQSLSSDRWESGLDEQINNNRTVWSWGTNSYGQLGNGHGEDQLIPRQLTNVALNLVQVTGGGGHSLFVTGRRQRGFGARGANEPLFSFNTLFSLCMAARVDPVRLRGGWSGSTLVAKAKVYFEHPFVEVDAGDLLTCGSNSKGQLGLGTCGDVATLTPVTALKDTKVSMVAGGWDFTLAVTDNGELYSWGSNRFGQLGDTDVGTKSHIPVRVGLPDQEPVCHVAAGLRHSVALSVSGRVYCWGHGKKGQCGIVVDGKPTNCIAKPARVNLPRDCGTAVQIGAGSYHTGTLTSTGNILVWGCNKFGQATQDPKVICQVNEPCLVAMETFEGSKVKDIQTGWTHLMATTEDGRVYSWGRGDYGQLGRSHDAPCDHVPRRIDALNNVKALCCGSEHNVAISDDHQLVAWGWNEHGMCGTGDGDNVPSPRVVKHLADNAVIQIGCGAGHCFVVTERREGTG